MGKEKQNEQEQEIFIKVPNQMIKYSCKLNHIILPIFLYSGVHTTPYLHYIVDTNIAHILETFTPNEDSRRGYNQKVISGLQTLFQGVNCTIKENIIIEDDEDKDEESRDSNNKDSKSNKVRTKSITYKFDSPFQLISTSNIEYISNHSISNKIDKDTRLLYYYTNREINEEKGWTKITYEEYLYLVDTITEINKNKKGKEKWNLIDLINLYCYLKMQIYTYENLSEIRKTKLTMHESVDSLSDTLQVGSKTITKYIRQLSELGMISIKRGNFVDGSSNEYHLSDGWKEKLNN